MKTWGNGDKWVESRSTWGVELKSLLMDWMVEWGRRKNEKITSWCGQKQVYRRKSALRFGTLLYALWNQTAWSTSENPPLTGWVARICLQGRRPWFDSWVGKIPWRRTWQVTPVFLPGEFPWTEVPGGLHSMGLQRVRHNGATKHSWMVSYGSPVGLLWVFCHCLAVFLSQNCFGG